MSPKPSIDTALVEKPHKPSFKDTLLGDLSHKHFSHFDEFDYLFNAESYEKGPNQVEGVPVIFITKEEHKKLYTSWKKH